jgi:peptidyl-tRNA hydrolase
MTEFELIQPIVLLVDRDNPSPDVDGIAAVAEASVTAYWRATIFGQKLGAWDEWLSGPFAKTVRRADRKTFDKLRALFTGDASPTRVCVGSAEALAFNPIEPGSMPSALKRLQVSGTTLPRGEADVSADRSATIVLNEDLGMSTGKAAAQAAHALFALHLTGDRHATVSTPRIRFASRTAIDEILNTHESAVSIVDAGRTEIEPGSLTAIAF